MSDAKELQEDLCYLALKNALDQECFSRRWSTVPLFREEGMRLDTAILAAYFLIGASGKGALM